MKIDMQTASVEGADGYEKSGWAIVNLANNERLTPVLDKDDLQEHLEVHGIGSGGLGKELAKTIVEKGCYEL